MGQAKHSLDCRPGATMVELTIAFALFSMIMAIPAGFTLSLFQRHALEQETAAYRALLLSARRQALAQGSGGQPFGVRIESDRYVVFVGSAYDTRDQLRDVIMPRDASVRVTGFGDVVFSPGHADARTAGNIHFESGPHASALAVSSAGAIWTP